MGNHVRGRNFHQTNLLEEPYACRAEYEKFKAGEANTLFDQLKSKIGELVKIFSYLQRRRNLIKTEVDQELARHAKWEQALLFGLKFMNSDFVAVML